ncbi:MAG: endonuclease III domain-containing protein [Candidatus Aenigmatarchaeota archaeon]
MELMKIYKKLFVHFGEQNWWPCDIKYHKEHGTDPRFEIMIGAILTQNTNWKNVEKALKNLKSAYALDPKKIAKMDLKKLQNLIRSSGFFKQKADRLKNFSKHIDIKYNGDLDKFFKRQIQDIRNELLGIKGIGYETADSILLYAGQKPIFVIDAYTKRLCKRFGLEIEKYDSLRKYFEKNLPKNVKLYKEFHALIVALGKNYCKKNPLCIKCPLNSMCPKISLS